MAHTLFIISVLYTSDYLHVHSRLSVIMYNIITVIAVSVECTRKRQKKQKSEFQVVIMRRRITSRVGIPQRRRVWPYDPRRISVVSPIPATSEVQTQIKGYKGKWIVWSLTGPVFNAAANCSRPEITMLHPTINSWIKIFLRQDRRIKELEHNDKR